MTSIGWLHLSDLHTTLRAPGWRALAVQRLLRADLKALHARSGPWDLVLVTGDLSMRGVREELEEAGRGLDDLLAFVRRLNGGAPEPCLLAVPGNHDLVRPADGQMAAYRALRRWHGDPEIQAEFWNNLDCPARRLVDRALEPFEKWWNAQGVPSHVRLHRGLLPGDFTATVEKQGLRLGVAGLCSTFLQVTDDDYLGRLALSPHQLLIAAGGDVPAWVARHDAVILMTHHAPQWLAPGDQQRYSVEVNPAGRFAVHLSGHLHEDGNVVDFGGRVQARSSSLFGAEMFADGRGRPAPRRFGYLAGRLDLDSRKSRGELSLWSREATDGGLRPGAEELVREVGRLPRPKKEPLAFSPARAGFRDALAEANGGLGDPRLLARAAGLKLGRGAGSAAIDLWHVIVDEAERRGNLDVLAGLAHQAHPEADALLEAWGQVEKARASVPRVRRGSYQERRVVELSEALGALLPAELETVVALAGLDPEALAPGALPSRRAFLIVTAAEERGEAGLEALLRAVERITFGRGRRDSGGAPTRESLAKLIRATFPDERDFDGFVLTNYIDRGLKLAYGPSLPRRIDQLLDVTDPADVVSKLKRTNPAAFSVNRRLLDYQPAERGESFRGPYVAARPFKLGQKLR